MMAVTEHPSSLGDGPLAAKVPPSSITGRGYDDDAAAAGLDSAQYKQSNTKLFSLPKRLFAGNAP